MSYTVVVTREDGNWLADVPEVEGTHTYARTLVKLDAEVREAIALALDLPEGAEAGLDLNYQIHDDAALDVRVNKLRKKREIINTGLEQLQQETPKVVAELLAAHYSVRDIAFRTGLTFQRVSQIKQELRIPA